MSTDEPQVEQQGPPPLPGPLGPTEPVSPTERIEALDVLRGFALFGILVVNIQAFAMISPAYMNPTAYGDFRGANRLVWLVTHVLFEMKFMTLFAMLFGAGVVLMTGRAEAAGRSGVAVHLKRMGWLIVFGLAHGYLLWYGDILVWYGLCGLVVVWLRRASPALLGGLGLAAVGITSLLSLLIGWSMPYWPEESRHALRESWDPSSETIEAELAAYRGGWQEQTTHRAPMTLGSQTIRFLVWGAWRVGGVMLLGMALFKLGVLGGQRAPPFYLRLCLAGFLVGIPIVLLGVQQQFAHDWDYRYGFFLGSQYNYWASLPVSLGWVGLVLWICTTGALPALRRGLAAVGQMALTNYLMQTIIATTIFYGHGLGLFGRVERVGQLAIVLVIFVAQVFFSLAWLQHFRFGPFEWLWRSLTYGRRQPLWK